MQFLYHAANFFRVCLLLYLIIEPITSGEEWKDNEIFFLLYTYIIDITYFFNNFLVGVSLFLPVFLLRELFTDVY